MCWALAEVCALLVLQVVYFCTHKYLLEYCGIYVYIKGTHQTFRTSQMGVYQSIQKVKTGVFCDSLLASFHIRLLSENILSSVSWDYQ